MTGPTSRGPTHEAAGGEPVFGAEVGRGAPGGGAEVGRRGGGGFGRFKSIPFLSDFPRINVSRYTRVCVYNVHTR